MDAGPPLRDEPLLAQNFLDGRERVKGIAIGHERNSEAGSDKSVSHSSRSAEHVGNTQDTSTAVSLPLTSPEVFAEVPDFAAVAFWYWSANMAAMREEIHMQGVS